MWKRTVVLIFVTVIVCARAQAKVPDRPIDKDTVRMAITIFRRTPTNQQGSMARPIIIRYAQESPDVHIDVSTRVMPWMANTKGYDDAVPVLLTAYVAGDVQAQLDRRKPKDDPMAGTEQVIATYQQMQRTEPRLRIMEVEKLIDLKKQGKLAKHLENSAR